MDYFGVAKFSIINARELHGGYRQRRQQRMQPILTTGEVFYHYLASLLNRMFPKTLAHSCCLGQHG
jgi:hypothetical protein